MTLHSEIGRNLCGVWLCFSLGMRVMKVEFKDGSIHLLTLDSSTTCQTSSLIKSQKLWKKSEVKPSSPGAFPTLSYRIAVSTSYKYMGLRMILLCSSVTILGIILMIFSIAGIRSVPVSWCTLQSGWGVPILYLHASLDVPLVDLGGE